MTVHPLHHAPPMRVAARREDGFTLLELMMAVVIIGILAAVAIVAYQRHIRKAKSSEVPFMFGLFRTGEEQYQTENGVYCGPSGMAACPAAPTGTEGTNWFPTTSKGDRLTDISAGIPTSWRQMHILPPASGLYCQYNVVAGPANDAANMGALGIEAYTGFPTPTKNWFYMLAQCDWNSNGSDYSTYYARADASGYKVKDEGK